MVTLYGPDPGGERVVIHAAMLPGSPGPVDVLALTSPENETTEHDTLGRGNWMRAAFVLVTGAETEGFEPPVPFGTFAF
jgi:hypothetical protein